MRILFQVRQRFRIYCQFVQCLLISYLLILVYYYYTLFLKTVQPIDLGSDRLDLNQVQEQVKCKQAVDGSGGLCPGASSMVWVSHVLEGIARPSHKRCFKWW